MNILGEPPAPAPQVPTEDIVRLARAAVVLGLSKGQMRSLLYRMKRTTFTRVGGVIEFVKVVDLRALFPDRFSDDPQRASMSEELAGAVATYRRPHCPGEHPGEQASEESGTNGDGNSDSAADTDTHASTRQGR